MCVTVRELLLFAYCKRIVVVCLLLENCSCVRTVRELLLFAYY